MKRLEAYGFKSFADKIELEFNPGITAIVGPNGSGKSNITDAVRWVLGEQNVRNLRGTKAEDIIFAGSASRRQLGVAEVSLFLENDGELTVDFPEVVVTRRLYRSGESEFYINKSRCRLKDIYTLFADTGLGHDGMSVIGQNRIDNILNSKPEERRLFFEETAGITKYKSRKKESVRKLNDTDSNLVRVDDIIQEIETQLGPLAEHAEKTRQYNALSDELQACQLTSLFYQAQDMKKAGAKTEAAVAAANDAEIAARTAMDTASARKEQISQELLAIEGVLQELAEKNNELRSHVEAANNEIGILAERQRQGEEDRLRIKSERDKLAKEADEAQETEKKLLLLESEQQAKLTESDKSLTAERTKASSFNQNCQAQKDLLEKSRQELQESQKMLLEKKNELQLLEHEIESSNENRDGQDKSRQSLATALQEVKAELERIEKETAALAEQKAQRQEQQAKRRKELRQAADKVQLFRQTAMDEGQHIRNTKDKLSFLQNMQQAYEGFGKAAKAVLKAQEHWKQGICGAVAELLTVPRAYVTAVEVALGSSAQNIVTADTDTAKSAISFLKKNRLGRVTFLPLSTIVIRKPQAEVRASGILGYANTLVKVEARYQKIVDFLLGRTLVVDNLNHALSIAKKQGYRNRIVTLEGELLAPGGSLSGGSRQHQGMSYLNRSGEIDKLSSVLAKAQDKLQALQQEQQEAEAAFGQLEQEAAEQEKLLQEMAVHEAELRVSSANSSAACQEKEQQLAAAQQLAAVMEVSFAKAQAQRVQAAKAVRGLEEAFHTKEDECSNAAEELDDREDDADELAKYISKLELDRAVMEQEMHHSRDNAQQYHHIRLQAEAALAKNEQSGQDLSQRLIEGAKKLEELREENQKWQEQQTAGEAEHKSHYEAKMSKLVEQQEIDKKTAKAAQELNQLQAKLHKLEIAAAEARLRLEQCEEKMMTDFGMTLDSAASKLLELPLDEIKGKIAELMQSIAALGTVNPNAVTEYEALQKRHGFMKKQADDLIEARDNLLKIVAEMDEAMTKQFQTAFAQIKVYFNDIFVQLFGGGKADLQLTDEAKVLESGVDIVVQLPEKKQQNMSALSGGERTLTVIALLFAFLRYKPSPFSVLDEIDAPLDEANISRFGAFLKKFAAHTQFIVVTHRKGTMEAADFMYGVTIEDAGVSKLVSVRLDDIQ